MKTRTASASCREGLRTVEEIVKKYFPDDVERERPSAGDLGRKLADETLERVKKALESKKKK